MFGIPLVCRFKVTVPDAKMPGSDKDLQFLPDQSFATPIEAKNAVALLPLLHFCRERPLERKLPDPYREMWLSVVGSPLPVAASKPDTASAPKAASATLVSTPAPTAPLPYDIGVMI